MSEISKEDMDLCVRIDSLLEQLLRMGDDNFVQNDNEEIFKYTFLARAVVEELIEPKPELFKSIAAIEKEFTEFVNQLKKRGFGEPDEELE